MYFTLASY